MSAAKRDPRRAELDKYLDAYAKLGLPEGNPFEQAVWCVLARNGTREGASKALAALWTRYVDVNELRVAQLDEVAAVIAPHVRNEADRVAALTRAFLRAIVRGQHQMSFDFVEEMSLDQLRKFLAELGNRAADVALAMLIHFCRAAIDADEPVVEVPEEEGGGKPRRKGEREVGPVLDRLRLLFTVAAYGKPDGKGQPATLVRRVLKLLDYTALPPRPAPEPRPAPVVPMLDDDDDGPDDADLAAVGKDEDLDEDLDDIYDEDEEFEEFEEEDEEQGTGKDGKKRATTRRKKTTRKTRPGARPSRKTTTKKAAASRGAAKKSTAKKGTPRKAGGKTTAKAGGKSGSKPAGKAAKTPRKPASKGTPKSAGASRSGGAARPRTTRKPARKSPTARKSSRRR